MRDADLSETFQKLAAIQRTHVDARAANRAWVAEHMPVVTRLFSDLEAAGMSPKLVKLTKDVP